MLNNLFVKKKKSGQINPLAIITFVLTLVLCILLIFAIVDNRTKVEMLTMEQLILEKSAKINDVILKLLYKTQILSTVIQQNGGLIENVEQVGSSIIDDPAIQNILLAPNGVVTDVFPREGNEAVIGLDFLSDGAGNMEAKIAKETKQLVLGGPFSAVQGGQVLVGRLPIYIDQADGTDYFWGLVSVTLKYPQALDGAELNQLMTQGFAFEIWRVNPDNNERQIIAGGEHDYGGKINYLERPLSIANAEWYFRILPVRKWYEFPETWVFLLISIVVSFLVAAVVHSNQVLKLLKEELVRLSNTDPLTGIHNRRHFMDNAARQMEKAKKDGVESYIILLDFDHFKRINDIYGHQTGDYVLKELSKRIANLLRPYDLLARYGGEEFIVFISDIHKDSVIKLSDRIREFIAETPININDRELFVSASIGVALASPDNDLETAISLSDKALYRAKAEGRNRYSFYDEYE